MEMSPHRDRLEAWRPWGSIGIASGLAPRSEMQAGISKAIAGVALWWFIKAGVPTNLEIDYKEIVVCKDCG